MVVNDDKNSAIFASITIIANIALFASITIIANIAIITIVASRALPTTANVRMQNGHRIVAGQKSAFCRKNYWRGEMGPEGGEMGPEGGEIEPEGGEIEPE